MAGTLTKEDSADVGTRDVGFECPDCGKTLESAAVFGAHRRDVDHRAPETPPGHWWVTWNDKGSSYVGMSETEAVAFIRGPASAFNDPDVRRSAKKAARSGTRPLTARAPQPRSRERRPRSRPNGNRARARSPGGDDSEPPLKPCAGCGVTFQPTRSNQSYHSDACRNAAKQRRFRTHERAAAAADEVLVRYRDEVARARRRDILTPDEAFELLLEPSQHVLALLAGEAA